MTKASQKVWRIIEENSTGSFTIRAGEPIDKKALAKFLGIDEKELE